MNYKLREYYLSNNTGTTIGFVKEFKHIDIVRTGSEKFFIIDFEINNKIQSNGLMIKHAKKDNNYFARFTNTKMIDNDMNIDKLKGLEIKILYSNKYPSFFKIQE